ncbi:hypothetical protein [Natronorubrum sp. DTA28]|uniref:hypothetical protein n=1 Tax=Natronorubrum sp. DTA28 TaxID=3447019 RepID=UPI003F84669D
MNVSMRVRSFSSPLIRDLALGLFLLGGTHLFVVDVRSFVSIGVVPSIVGGVVAGAVGSAALAHIERSKAATVVVVLVAGLGFVISWSTAAVVVGSDSASARIPAFALALLCGHIGIRLADSLDRP